MRKQQINFFFAFLLISIFFFSCKEVEDESTGTAQQTENYVNIEFASNIASNIEYPIEGCTSEMKNGKSKEYKNIENIMPIPDENGITVYYIINYKNNGFVIISADNRVNPILAFSSSGKFPLNESVYPNGVVEWLFDTKDYIKEIRLSNKRQTKQVAKAWDDFEIQRVIDPDDNDIPSSNCVDEYETIGPILQTTWGQGEGYNNLVPKTGCNTYGNGRAPTGCIATAMSQVIRYYRFPTNYNYDIMPNRIGYWDDWYSDGANEISKLMRDVGSAVKMSYSCDGSSADTESEVASSFKNDFGYTSASYADYNQETVKQQLRWYRPVILRGGRKSGWWIFATYADGHAWVCDGFRRSYICMYDDYGNSIGAVGYLYLHMNWGWNNAANGWFAFDNWNPTVNSTTYTFNYKRGMVYNIKP